ncbi:hypothetical protein EYV94_09270 [Puteibacter caeruleilacunae]|nr:hypothetical protein EYV94_09270 [Puteibacter caeruleilacunae]
MRILLVAATKLEVSQIEDELFLEEVEDQLLYHYGFGKHKIDVLITGIGIAFTTYFLTRYLNKYEYSFVINLGIAGSFQEKISIGSVVNVVEEEFAQLGIEDGGDQKTLFEVGYLNPDIFPFRKGKMINPGGSLLKILPEASGITSDLRHDDKESIAFVRRRFSPDVESMEGAAVFYVCLNENVPFFELRAISNYVDGDKKPSWNIPLALENLKEAFFNIVSRLQPVLTKMH